jgi:hypothetical protein
VHHEQINHALIGAAFLLKADLLTANSKADRITIKQEITEEHASFHLLLMVGSSISHHLNAYFHKFWILEFASGLRRFAVQEKLVCTRYYRSSILQLH